MSSTDSFVKANEFVENEARIIKGPVLIPRDNIVLSVFCDINNKVTL